MNEVMIEKYTKLLNTFQRVILNTKDEELKETTKESYVTFIYELAILEHKDLAIYEEMMKSLNISEEIIKTTLDNIKIYNPNEQKSNENIVQEDLSNTDIKNDETIENKENIEENIESVKEENAEENLEEYIYINVYRNKNSKIGDEFQKLVLKLQEDLKNPNDKSIKTWVNNYVAFANHYQDVLDKDKLIKYMYELFEKYDKENTYADKLSDFVKDNEKDSLEKNNKVETPIEDGKKEKINNAKEEKPLKILNIKKSFKSKKELAVLGTTALIGIGGAILGTPGLLVLPLAVIIHKLYKSKGLTNNKLKKFLMKYNYTIDEETKELKDNNGEVITKDKIGKAKYEMLKRYLLKLDGRKQDGEIKTEYKKNKVASKLLNSKFVEKLKNLKSKNESEGLEFEELEENQEMQKGMGKC